MVSYQGPAVVHTLTGQVLERVMSDLWAQEGTDGSRWGGALSAPSGAFAAWVQQADQQFVLRCPDGSTGTFLVVQQRLRAGASWVQIVGTAAPPTWGSRPAGTVPVETAPADQRRGAHGVPPPERRRPATR